MFRAFRKEQEIRRFVPEKVGEKALDDFKAKNECNFDDQGDVRLTEVQKNVFRHGEGPSLKRPVQSNARG